MAGFPFIQQFLALSIVTHSVLDAGATGEGRPGPVLAETDREVTYGPRAFTEVCASCHGDPEQCKTGVGLGGSWRPRVGAWNEEEGPLEVGSGRSLGSGGPAKAKAEARQPGGRKSFPVGGLGASVQGGGRLAHVAGLLALTCTWLRIKTLSQPSSQLRWGGLGFGLVALGSLPVVMA